MSWYRTYRPQTVSGLHIASVRNAYQHILETGVFAHAYLMAGPKGTGKTSGARILAKVFNCEQNRAVIEGKKGGRLNEPCNQCGPCQSITNGSSLSVTEIDAASNRGIDDIRALRETIHLLPPDGAMSVYIIDEVHMLTTEAFNALLKVLEEPPAHVVFLLATTELSKLPATIVSRCSIIPYTKASQDEITRALLQIVEAEKISIDPSFLGRFVSAGDGSFRDAVKLFEQVCGGSTGQVTLADIDAVLGASIKDEVVVLIQHLLARDYDAVKADFTRFESSNTPMAVIQKDVINLLLEASAHPKKTPQQKREYVALMQSIAVAFEPNIALPHIPFVLGCLSWCMQQPQTEEGRRQSGTLQSTPVSSPPSAGRQSPGHQKQEIQEKKVETASGDKHQELKVERAAGKPIVLEEITKQWQDVLVKLGKKNSSLEAFLRTMRVTGIDNNRLVLQAGYKFHKEQLETAKNRTVVEDVLESVYGTPVFYVIVLTEAAIAASALKDSNISGSVDDAPLVAAAADVFLS